MNNTEQQPQSPLVVFSGFVAEVNAPDMPAGSAVLATDCDFTVASVRTRDGLENVYTYCGQAPESAADSFHSVGANPWSGPSGAPPIYTTFGESCVESNPMAITVNAGNFFGATTGIEVGDTMIVIVTLTSNTGFETVTSVTDSLGNTYTPLAAAIEYNVPSLSKDFSMQPFAATMGTARAQGASFTLTTAIAGYVGQGGDIQFTNWRGLGAVDQVQSYTSATATINPSITLGSSAFLMILGTLAFHVPTGWTYLSVANDAFQAWHTGTANVTPPGTYPSTWVNIYSPSALFQIDWLVAGSGGPPFSVTLAPGTTSAMLEATGYGFSIPADAPILGIEVQITGFESAGGTVRVSAIGGSGTSTVVSTFLPSSSGTITIGTDSDLWGESWTAAQINSPGFGFAIVAEVPSGASSSTFTISAVSVTVWYAPTPRDFNHITSFEMTDGGVLTLALDDTGVWWEEDVINNPGVLCPFYTAIEPDMFARAVTEDDREFVVFSDLQNGADIPRQYNGTWVDRLSQVGPGAPPSISFTQTTYGVVSITQPGTVPIGGGGGTSGPPPVQGGVQWSAGVNSGTPGNVLTVYGASPDFITGVEVGSVVYLQLTGSGLAAADGTYLVTAVGSAFGLESGDGTLFYYFQVTAPGTSHVNTWSNSSPVGTYELTEATLTTSVPLPGIQVGSQITLSGVTPGSWDSTWTITGIVNGGNFQITETQLVNTGGASTAIYNYELTSVPPVAPVVGSLVTITGCVNGPIVNGQDIFNVFQAPVSSVTPSSSTTGQFTIGPPYVEYATDIPAAPETEALGIILGTEFNFEPALQFVGTGTNPIFGTGTGGQVVIAGGLGPGERGVVVLFLTRNGFLTPASPPFIFNLTANANQIVATQLPIGPPNVIARVLAFTGAGGVVGSGGGGYYFWIPTPVTTVSSGQTVTYDATIIPDNVTTQATFTFTDAVLLAAESISTQGSNNFQQIELGSAIGITAFSQRLFVWGEQNKVQNLINMSFDGGYLATSSTTDNQPLGWTIDPVNGAGGALVNSPIFGQAYQITSSGASFTGMITQGAYQDAYGVPILLPSTMYSLRVTCKVSALSADGQLTIDVYSPGAMAAFGGFGLGLAQMTTTMAIYTGTFLATPLPTRVLSDLLIRVYGQNMDSGAQVTIDRIEVFPTNQPNLVTNVRASYFDNFEAFDAVTGNVGFGASNQQPVRNAFSLFDNLYVVKTRSIYSTTDNGVTEPSGWTVREVSNKVGTPSIFGVDVGEGWALVAGQAGLYLFDGGDPHKISPEMDGNESDPGPWQLVNWKYGNSLWLRNDTAARKITIGLPMITPNKWCPDFPANANPTSPNVVLMCNYKQLMSSSSLEGEAPIRLSFQGELKTYALGRKWSLWSIEAGYADFITRPDTTQKEFFCNNTGSSKIYQQIGGLYADDGEPMHCEYITYPAPKVSEAQATGMGLEMLEATYMTLLIRGGGNLIPTIYPNTPDSPYADTMAPFPLADPMPAGDLECPLNEVGNRFFIGCKVDLAGEWFELSRIVLTMEKNPWAPVRGSN